MDARNLEIVLPFTLNRTVDANARFYLVSRWWMMDLFFDDALNRIKHASFATLSSEDRTEHNRFSGAVYAFVRSTPQRSQERRPFCQHGRIVSAFPTGCAA